MSEKTDYQTLRKNLGHCHLERIENMAGVGTPDVYYCIDGRMGWIEMKSPKEPKRPTSKLFKFKNNHKLNQAQMNWFLSLRNAGGRAYILICTDKRWMLINGCQYANEINEMMVDELWIIAELRCMKPIHKMWWNLLRRKLKGE